MVQNEVEKIAKAFLRDDLLTDCAGQAMFAPAKGSAQPFPQPPKPEMGLHLVANLELNVLCLFY